MLKYVNLWDQFNKNNKKKQNLNAGSVIIPGRISQFKKIYVHGNKLFKDHATKINTVLTYSQCCTNKYIVNRVNRNKNFYNVV